LPMHFHKVSWCSQMHFCEQLLLLALPCFHALLAYTVSHDFFI
jgi:hypothetical protein